MAGDVMKKNMIAAVAVVIIILIAGVIVALSMSTPGTKGNDDGSNDDNTDNSNNTTDNTTSNTTTLSTTDLGDQHLNITFPKDLASAQSKVAISVTYPGKDVEGYNYTRAQTYRFQVQSTPASGYSGDVLIRVFAELTDAGDEIDPHNIAITNATGKAVSWTSDTRIGNYVNYVVLSGDLGAFRTNGNATDNRTFDVKLNYIGNFTLTFQAFDLNTSAALSAPTTAGPMYVPIKGSLSIQAKSLELFQNETGEWYRVLINVTNNWNIRHTVYASGFVLNNTVDNFAVNDSATAFDSQQLIPLGGTSQFFVYFDATGNPADFTMKYVDPENSDTYVVGLPQ